MRFLQITSSALLGFVVTLALLVLMYTMIESADKNLDETEYYKIADFIQQQRQIDENIKQEKPEKPSEAQQPPPAIPKEQVDLIVPESAVNIALPRMFISVSVGLNGNFARDSDYIPVYVPQPMYPRRAQTRGIGGYAVIEVTITSAGAVRDPKLLEEDPSGYGFGKEALKASRKMKYNPRVIDGVAEEVSGVLYKFTFIIEK